MLDRARTGAFSTAEIHGLGILSYLSNVCFPGAINPIRAARVLWGCQVLCGSAPGKALPSRSHHVQQTAFMASRKITWYLFPPHDKHFRDTYSSPVAYTNVWLRQWHTQARAPCSSSFLLTAFLSWYSEVSTPSSKVHPPGTVSSSTR